MRWVVFLLFATAADAACPEGGELYFACTFEQGSKRVVVCHDTKTATYVFGPSGGSPELFLKQPITDIDYSPWPGAGSTVWEELTFHSQNFSYLIEPSINRQFPESEDDEIIVTVEGAIVVSHNDNEIARLACDEGSVHFPWGSGIFEAKEALGQCYENFEWAACQ